MSRARTPQKKFTAKDFKKEEGDYVAEGISVEQYKFSEMYFKDCMKTGGRGFVAQQFS